MSGGRSFAHRENTMKGFLVCGTLVIGVVAGCGSAPPAPEATATSESPIQGGTTDKVDDFAVGIELNLGGDEGAICSGALLAPNLVATARHCAAELSSDQVECATSTFGSAYSPSQFAVTNSTVFSDGASVYGVAKVVTPTGTDQVDVCGNDIALLILDKNIPLAQYVVPVISPPMTDHTVWSTTVTAIGYGIDSPTDSTGASAGTRRILENIALTCIPNDTTFTDCYANAENKLVLAPSEFESGNGTCEGDSGSNAYDQTQFNNGKWVSFGVLSRGGVSRDGQTCVGSIYTRFDAWAQLLIDTANEAATMGGYAAPSWVNTALTDGGSNTTGTGDSGSGKSDGSVCTADAECSSQSCVSTDGTQFSCASPCGTNDTCSSGFSCLGGYCFANPATSSKKGGCAVSGGVPGLAEDRTQPVPWRTVALALGAVGLAFGRRRR